MDPRRRLLLRGSTRAATAKELTLPLRPPWSLDDEQDFLARCTRCDACVAICPHRLIARGDGGYPEIGFMRRGCDLCGKCLDACPHGALSRNMAEHPIRWRVAVDQTCLAQQRVECRSCAEACEPRALRFVLVTGGIMQLETDPAACNGCGECVAPCPVGAISMKRSKPAHEETA